MLHVVPSLTRPMEVLLKISKAVFNSGMMLATYITAMKGAVRPDGYLITPRRTVSLAVICSCCWHHLMACIYYWHAFCVSEKPCPDGNMHTLTCKHTTPYYTTPHTAHMHCWSAAAMLIPCWFHARLTYNTRNRINLRHATHYTGQKPPSWPKHWKKRGTIHPNTAFLCGGIAVNLRLF